jgi:hypothetical protein
MPSAPASASSSSPPATGGSGAMPSEYLTWRTPGTLSRIVACSIARVMSAGSPVSGTTRSW